MTMTVAEKIDILRKRQKMQVGELAEKTGQTRQNLSNKMNRGNFSEKEIHALAEALGCTVDIVFTMPDGTQI